jgi:hypothetical protein
MTEDVQNQTLVLLREMRKETQGNFADLNAKIAALAEGQVRMTNRMDKMEKSSEKSSSEIREDLREIKNHITVVSIVVDEHAKRLDALDGGQPHE